MSPAEPLDAETLRAALGEQTIGNRIVVLEETTSTNDVATQLAPTHSEGLVVIAETQTAGRGQYGRRWVSAVGKGLWLSILLRPRITVADSARLTDLLARSVASTIADCTGLTPFIKPPNDVYIEARKIAGVLVEMRVEADGNYCAIAGLGVNLNQAPEDFPEELRETAGSISICLGRAVDRAAFAIALLRELNLRYRAFSDTPEARAAS